jgi:TRAP-type C4-dicarboxylate transport system substrate-binding protein
MKRTALFVAGIFVMFAGSLSAQEFKLTHQWKQGTDVRDQAARIFVEEVTQKDPTIKFRIYPGASLISNPVKQLDAIQDGTIDMAIYPLIYGVGKIPELSVTILPGAVDSIADAMKLKNSAYARRLQQLVEANGFHILTWWWTDGGIATRVRPVTGPESVKGLKMRGADRTIDTVLKSAGASVVEMPSTELYSALQSGVLDGLMTSNETFVSMRLYEQTKYATLGGDYSIFMLIQPLIISKKAWDKLTPPQRKIFEDAAAKSEAFFVDQDLKLNKGVIVAFEKSGVKVRQMTKGEHDEWIALAKRTSWPEFASVSPGAKELLDALQHSRTQ